MNDGQSNGSHALSKDGKVQLQTKSKGKLGGKGNGKLSKESETGHQRPEPSKADVYQDVASWLRIPSDPPVFTTPILDFSSHHSELSELTIAVIEFASSYHTKHYPPPHLSSSPSSNASKQANALPTAGSNSRTGSNGRAPGAAATEPATTGLALDRLLKNRRIVTAVSIVMAHFNLLTTPNPLHRTRTSTCKASTSETALHDDAGNSLVPCDGNSWPSLESTHMRFDTTLGRKQRAAYHYLRGRLFTVLPWPDVRAEADLTMCLKLDSAQVDAWNLLGEWYYGCCSPIPSPEELALLPMDASRYRPRISSDEARRMARSCFERGLEVSRNRDGLLHLAMTIRASAAFVGTSRMTKPQKSVRKKASTSDSNPSSSKLQQQKEDIAMEVSTLLERSVGLCKEALAFDVTDGLSWFGLGSTFLKIFFSVSFDFKDIQNALKAYNKAAASVQMLNYPDLYRNRAMIHIYLENYTNAFSDFERSAALDPFDIGPDSINQIHTGDTILEKVFELNSENVVVFKIVDVLPWALPRMYVGKDSSGAVFGVSIFNISDTATISAGDVLTVASPVVMKFDVTYGKYLNLRIERPWLLAINGRVLGKHSVAITEVRVQTMGK
ncbi:Tetratricopeptide repeat protein 5 [Phlyctochytrium planicorne]|nr:Tetratricopeptide repeat protein 5 [Phlyctochytrium planicorne]